ncbi:hypothetical protein KUTeg_019793 [Tegillarca granosa]|uniref:Uncharacterized protein n=1 Tax=Tegillarca granosa TaxID=220873 RepID=A0ABQ9EDL5_TEGGR|nr:hypothetical protein KUTeg_019793 [Tegillarca granosa]
MKYNIMDPTNLSRLKEEQEKVLASTDEKIEQWQKFKTDYKALKDRLKTLPDKVTHDVMVPFGSLAFMPGKLVHTNEIMVLLGDNWFVERSAKQAAAIVDRRIKSVNTELEALQKQRSLFEPRIDFTSELQQDAEAFTGTIVEKPFENPTASISFPTENPTALIEPSPTESSSSVTPSQNEPPKRVSKFKVQRQN